MDREIPENVKKEMKQKKIIKVSLYIGIPILLLAGLKMLISPSLDKSRILTAVVETGNVLETVSGTGIVKPGYEETLISPFQSVVMDVLKQEGEPVKAGTSILKLDTTSFESELNRQQDEYSLLENRKQRSELAAEKTILDLKTQMDIKKLKIESFHFKLKQSQALFDFGQISKEKLNEDTLNYEISRKELKQMEGQMENLKQSLKMELQGMTLEMAIQSKLIEEKKRMLMQAEARATVDGVLTYVNRQIGVSVPAASVLARVADLNSFKIEARISDIHLDKIIPGRKVVVRVNQTDLEGVISQINPSVNNSVVNFSVTLNNDRHEVLRSDQKVDVFVVLNASENVLRVKNGPFFDGNRYQDVFVIQGDMAVKKHVEFGESNVDYVRVLKGLDKGDVIIISDMEKYIHHTDMKID